MQATCDNCRCFINIDIRHPAATLDYLAFTTSSLNKKLETEGFLHPDLANYGDCAYVNSNYMATPFKGVAGGDKDAYNYYHSQVRINIECAFGMLVHQFRINVISIQHIVALVMSLCRLHNFCINNNDEHIPKSKYSDVLTICWTVVLLILTRKDTDYRPFDLLDGGMHQTDHGRHHIRNVTRALGNQPLPHDTMLKIKQEKDLKRPTPANWKE
jgi:DDE superfamily endonuclease